MKKLFLLGMMCAFSLQMNAQQGIWQEVSQSVHPTQRTWTVEKARYFVANKLEIQNALSVAPMRNLSEARGKQGVTIELPMPYGGFASFMIEEDPIMPASLAAQFPDIKTYSGFDISNPSTTIVCDVTPAGFHGYILSAQGTVYIDPTSSQSNEEYVVYYKHDVQRQSTMYCEVETARNASDLPLDQLDAHLSALNGRYHATDLPEVPSTARSLEGSLRTYRLALACTGEYAAFHGGNVNTVFGAMATSIARVNGVYEKEFGIRMEFVPNNQSLIYLDAATDPYSNNSGGTMLGQNQNNVNTVIGSANYDIGHVFSTGGGGIASLGCVCSNTNKARGVTGSSAPVGDPFDIDYVAHEMGHQFGGNHTFNSSTDACGGGNRSGNTAYEPGSGTTIMAYAGICSPNNTQNNSDPYFHVASFDEIANFITLGNGKNCPVTTVVANNAPIINSITASGFNIPTNTHFFLDAKATDPNNDPITYCWEQYDLGSACDWAAPVGNAPLFRSYLGTASGRRVFPKMSAILNGQTQVLGEILPSYARSMKFRCMVRDSKAGGGATTYNDNAVTVNVVSTGAPFKITSYNTGIPSIIGATMVTINWDVAGTTATPISTPKVNILYSTDGGATFPITLAANVDNDGSESVWMPNIATTKGRIWVEGVNNIFFDVNDKDITVFSNVSDISDALTDAAWAIYPNPTTGVFTVNMQTMQKNTTLTLVNAVGQTVFQQWVTAGENEAILDITALPVGIYMLRWETPAGIVTKKVIKS